MHPGPGHRVNPPLLSTVWTWCGHGVGDVGTYMMLPRPRLKTQDLVLLCCNRRDEDYPAKMSSQDESARLFQKTVVFKYVADNRWSQTKDILVSRDKVAQYDVCGVLIISTLPLDPLTGPLFRLQWQRRPTISPPWTTRVRRFTSCARRTRCRARLRYRETAGLRPSLRLVSLKRGSGLNGIRALERCGKRPQPQVRGNHHHHQL